MPKKLRVSNGFPVKHILVMFFILFLSFSINFFGVGERGWYEKYQVGSDALVFNKLACLKADHQTGWLIWREAAELNNINPVCKSDGQAYFSQIGLQGRVMAYAYKYFNFISISMAKYILLLKLLAPLFSAVTLLLFSYWVIKRFGLTEAYIVTILIANSVWIVGFSKSLFWSMPLLFLPFISTLFLAKKSKSRSRDGILFLLLTLLMMFKFASGYEYASVIIMSIVGAVVTVGIIDSYKRQRIQYLIIISIAAGLIAFTATIGLHTILINKEFNNERHSLSIIYKRFIYRTAKTRRQQKGCI
jgi:hypothetical protein